MAWYNAILGGGSTPTNGLQSSSASNTYPSGMMQSSSTSAMGSILPLNGGAGQSYWATAQAQQAYTGIEHQAKVYALKSYADVIGWALEHYRLPEGTTSNDPKIAILKISTIGEVIKDVGVRTSETDFYIMRQPGE